MSTHNICFHAEIRKMLTCYPLLYRPMGVHAFVWLFFYRSPMQTQCHNTIAPDKRAYSEFVFLISA